MEEQRPSMPGLAEGAVVCGTFRLERLLRRDAAMSVYLARALGDDEPGHVARVIHVPRGAAARRAEAFEAAAARWMELQIAPRMVAAHVEEGEPVVVSERVGGVVLGAVASREAGAQPLHVATLMAQIAATLDGLHAQVPPVVHERLTPESVTVDPAGRAWVEGCGIVHVLVAAGWSRDEIPCAWPEYVPPDHARVGLGPRADVFALAVIAFECLTGRLPLVGEVGSARASQDSMPLVTALRPTLPRAVDAVFLRAWNAEDNPYETAGEFAAELLRALDAPLDVRPNETAPPADLSAEPDQSFEPVGDAGTVPTPPPLPAAPAHVPNAATTIPGGYLAGAPRSDTPPEGAPIVEHGLVAVHPAVIPAEQSSIPAPRELPVRVSPTAPPLPPPDPSSSARVARTLGFSVVVLAAIAAVTGVYLTRMSQEHELALLRARAAAAPPAAPPAPVPTPLPAALPSPPAPVAPLPAVTPPPPAEPLLTPDAAVAVALPDVPAARTPAPTLVVTPTPVVAARPSAAEVQRVRARLASAVTRCIAGRAVGPSVRLVVTYAGRSGRATHVEIPGPANNEPTGACLEGAVYAAPLAPFAAGVWQTEFSFPGSR
jgi:hypothetical protein